MAMYGYEPTFDIRIADDAMEGEVPAAKERVEMLQDVRNTLTQRWQNAADAQAKYYNRKHKPKSFNVDDLVMLSAKNLKQKKPSKKLSNKMIGPFRILEPIGKQAYRLDLSATYRIHPVFHVSLLEPYNRRQNDDSIPEYLAPELIDDEQE